MIEIGIISEVSNDRARVTIGSMVTDFLPVMQLASSFARSWSPIRVGEQCAVLPVRGSLNAGVILRGIYQNAHTTPSTDTNKQICVFEDGVRMSYDVRSSTLEISSPKQINITCEDANVKAKNVKVEATDTQIKSPSIKLLSNTLIEGSINTAGAGGGSGSFEINGNVKITGSLSAGGDAKFGGSVSDSRGDLTNHTNNGLGRD